MNLSDLVVGLGLRIEGDASARVCDITDDSRTVLPGSLFVARGGTETDGRRYIASAVEAGAAAVLTDERGFDPSRRVTHVLTENVPLTSAMLAERFYGEPSKGLFVIGITGTNGKTTTAHLIHGILNRAGTRCGLIGTVVVDDGAEVARATLTTPPAFELSRTLALMVESGCKAVVMEASSHALDQDRVSAIDFDVGVFTNLTGDHLDYHVTERAYARAKARLFALLGDDGHAIVNIDDPASGRMLRDCRARVLRCTLGRGEAECRAETLALTMDETRVRLTGPWGEVESSLKMVGSHNAINALQAVAACHVAGCSADDLLAGLARADAPPGRLEPVHTRDDPVSVLVDYGHTDDAMRNVLEEVGRLVPGRDRPGGGRLWVVFGCGGDRDRTKRPRMGAVAAELADRVVVTSDNPRTEQPEAIIDQILQGIDPSVRYDPRRLMVEPDRAEAIALAVERAEPGDVVIITGKGHETEQIIPDGMGGTITRPFDDRLAARQALRRRCAPA